MSLTLRESKAISEIAHVLYDFLPGSGDPNWRGHVSFRTVAQKVGVGDFWQAGSKEPMIVALLHGTLEHRRGRFERLILEVVRAGLAYRERKGRPVKPAEIELLNGLLLDVGFKFPDLWDHDFLAALRIDGARRAREHVERALTEEKLRESREVERSRNLRQLRDDLFGLQSLPPQLAGLRFEKVLNRLFALHGLAPREPFRVTGEQIDGSFDLDHETYLVEAKWEQAPVAEAPLLVFRGKIEGKSAYTRGLFISLNGITGEAKKAITTGKQPTFFVVDGYDLTMVLSGEIELPTFLRQRRRLLAEEGTVSVPFCEIWAGSRNR